MRELERRGRDPRHDPSRGVEHGTYDTDDHGGFDTSVNPVSGGDHGHASTHDANPESYPTHEGQLDSSRWPDMNGKELLVIIPLAILTVFAGVYPKPLFDIMEPSLMAVLEGASRVVGN